jgi:hypothetical protein
MTFGRLTSRAWPEVALRGCLTAERKPVHRIRGTLRRDLQLQGRPSGGRADCGARSLHASSSPHAAEHWLWHGRTRSAARRRPRLRGRRWTSMWGLLEVARRKHSAGRFFTADVSDFALDHRYDVILRAHLKSQTLRACAVAPGPRRPQLLEPIGSSKGGRYPLNATRNERQIWRVTC